MKKILVPVDFSENTWSVCQYALLLAGNESTEIRLFNSFFDQVIVTDSSFPTGIDTETMINEQLLMDIRQRSENDIQLLQSRLIDQVRSKGLKNIKVVYTLEGGEPEFEILDMENEYKPDLIVMGTHGSGEKGFLEGSVSKKIMDHAKAPVFAIPELKDNPVIGRVLYLSEISDADIPVLDKTFSILKHYNPALFFLHLLISNERQEAQERLKPIENHFADKEREGNITYHILPESNIQDDIEAFIREHDISLVAFIPHKKGFFKRLFYQGITKKNLLQTNMPLLAIRET
ncbi:MAG: universal stress protein [Bacteroidetes bacterium]|nr:universal stress protein [Bacteroidota bacterium]